MNNTPINIRRKRDLGDIITDTFKFIRRNLKQIFKLILKTTGVPMLLLIGGIIFNSITSLNFSLNITDPYAAFKSQEVIISTIILYLLIFIYISFLYAGVLSIIKSYIKNNGIIKDEEVTSEVKSKIGVIIGGGLLKYFVLFFSWMLCLIPGFIVCAPLLLIFPFIIFEDESPINAFKKSFELIKKDWLMTFLTLAIMVIIWYAISIVFTLPTVIYTMIKTFTVIQDGSLDNLADPILTTLTVVASVTQYLLYFVIPVSSAFMYYNLNERENNSGTIDSINQIGN